MYRHGRLLVVDESLTTRIGSELRKRGRQAKSLAELGLKGLKDEPMLRKLAEVMDEPYVLVSADDAMPATHHKVLVETQTTLATLHPEWRPTGLQQECYKHEVVHRWAHAMARQDEGSVRRYSPSANRPWVPLRRRPRRQPGPT